MRVLLGFAVVAVAALTALSPAFAVTYQTVALSGQQAPGLAEGVTFGPTHVTRYTASFSAFPNLVSLNNAGQVAFKGFVEGGDVVWQDALTVWMGKPESLSLIARTNQPTPGVPGEVLNYLETAHFMVLNDAGDVALKGYSGPSGGDMRSGRYGYLIYGSEGLAVAAMTGDAAPGMPEGTVFKRLANSQPMGTVFGGGGELAFRATVTTPQGEEVMGFWYGRGGELQRIDGVDGAPAVRAARLNNHGFLSAAGTGDAGTTIWVGKPGAGWTTIAANGDRAPGQPEGTTLSASVASINDKGQVAWYGAARRTSPDSWSGSGLWIGDADRVEEIAVTGDFPMNFPPDTVFENFSYMQLVTHVNGQGRSAFWATVGGPTTPDVLSLWVGSGEWEPYMIARADAALPGTTVDSWKSSFRPSMNASGQVVFAAIMDSGKGVWATDPLGHLVAVAAPGQAWAMKDGSSRTVKSAEIVELDGTGGQDGLARPINDAGWVAFTLEFTDGSSGVFLADTNVPGRTAGILKGVNQRGEVVGAPGDPGHVAVTFPTSEAGILLGTLERIDKATFDATHLTAAFTPVVSPAGDVPMWDLNFTGSFSGLPTLELAYDEAWLPAGLDESLLGIYHHRDDGAWELLPGSVNTVNNIITVTTASFCNFALGIVPEPTTTASLAALAFLTSARRRHCS